MLLFVFFAVSATSVYGQVISTCGSSGSNGTIDADETRPFILNCTNISLPPGDRIVNWKLKRPDGSVLEIANCTQSFRSFLHLLPWQCLPPVNDYYVVTMTQSEVSTLTVQQNHRTSIAGTVRCVGLSFLLIYDVDICKVRVIYPAKTVSNCRTEVNTSDWTVSGSCDVDKIYASDDHYSCRWKFPVETGRKKKEALSLTNFTEHGKAYKRGTCSFSGLPMPTFDGTYPFSLTIDPGNKTFHGQSLEISHPGAPTFHNCPAVITEGGDLNCTCQPSDSSPLALVTWDAGSILSGQLQVQNVSMKHNGMKYACTQSWGGCLRKRISYTIRVKRKNNDTGNHDDIDGGGGDEHLADADEEDGQSMLIAEVSVVVIVVAFVIIAAVLILFKKCDSRYVNPKRADPTEDSHIYSDLASLQESSTDRPGLAACFVHREMGFPLLSLINPINNL
ncbi:hypothetical protein V1264_010527 [Littorina saxatilis]|uniref:Ig-like domain-containing protein n=1 Tax=Littorina saxatilis TaxID=31220 RepID=A0AAN9G1S9_9CAEN